VRKPSEGDTSSGPYSGARETHRDAVTVHAPPSMSHNVASNHLREYVHARSLADKTDSLKALFPFPQQSYDTSGGRVYTLASAQPRALWVMQFTKRKRDGALRQGDDTLPSISRRKEGSADPADAGGRPGVGRQEE
jgi:hypothetical protein